MAAQNPFWANNPAPPNIPIFDIAQPGQPRRDQIMSADSWRAPPVPRVATYTPGLPDPIHTFSRVAVEGYIPSSCNRLQDTISASETITLKQQEDLRAERNLPKILRADERDQNKHYAQWAGGYIEATDDLLARCVCPADLLQYPCRFDELPGGCRMVRLCKQLENYTDHVCPDAGFRDVYYEGSEPSSCGHVHWEIEASCRFVVARNQGCDIIIKKGYQCPVGHDLAAGRKVARARFEAHIRDGLNAGACAVVKKRTMLATHHVDLEMARGNTAGLPYLGY